MSHFETLNNLSLLLVGTDIQLSPSISYDNSEKETGSVSENSDSVPDDERLMDCLLSKKKPNQSQEETTGIEAVMQPEQAKDVLVLVDDETSGPDEARWRAHGYARRRAILEEDRKNGGRNFSLSFECSVQRYFSVAHWALEQFHQLYQNKSSSMDQEKMEEIYVMGVRIISFLTECLPKHPGYKSSSLIQERSKHELEHLRKCLKDVSLKIDESVCNKFVEDGDMFLESLEDADDENTSSKNSSSNPIQDKITVFESWVNFDEFNKMEQQNSGDAEQARRLTQSPTSETVGTTGSDSGDGHSTSNSEGSKYVRQITDSDGSVKPKGEEGDENAFDFGDRVIREDTFEMDDATLMDEFSLMDESLKSYSSQPFTLLRKSVSLNFLKSIACEPVLYETDSDAADSWANNDADPKARPCVPSSSGVAPTSDPARIAFRNLMNKQKSILNRDKKQDIGNTKSDDTEPPRPASPTFSDIMEERDIENVASLDEQNMDEAVDHEIQEYLDKKMGKLDKKLNSWNEKLGKLDKKLNKNPGSKSGRSSQSSRGNSRGSSRNRNSSTSDDASSYSSSSASASTEMSASSRRGRRSRGKDRKLKPSTSYDDSSSASGVYTDLRTNRSSRRSDYKLKSSKSSDVSVQSSSSASASASASHRNSRRSSTSRRKVDKQRIPVYSDESSYTSSSTSSTDDKIRTRRSPRRESRKYHVSSDTSTSSTESLSSSYDSMASSSYTSLKHLRKQRGSENSAFTSVRKTEKKRQERKQKQKKSVATDKVKDDWISFENFTGSSYFANAFK